MATIDEVIQRVGRRTKAKDIETYAFDHVSHGSIGVRLDEASPSAIQDYLARDETQTYSVFTERRLRTTTIFTGPTKLALNYTVTRGMAKNKIPPSTYLIQGSLSAIGVDMPDEHTEQRGASLAPDTKIDTILPELIDIGDGVQIGTGAVLASHANLGGSPIKDGDTYKGSHWRVGLVTIEKYAEIGAQSIIGPGTSVGSYSEITTRSMLMENTVPPGTTASCYQPHTQQSTYSERPRTIRRVTKESGEPRIERVTI